MNNSTFMPGDLVMIRQDAWFTDVNSWTLSLTKKSLKGIFLGTLKEENKSYHEFVNPCKIAIDGDKIIVVDINKINYFNKRRSYEKVN
jgi:hypothetical protein